MHRPRSAARGALRLPLVLATMLLVVVASACRSGTRKGNADLQIRIAVDPGSPSVGSARILVTVGSVAWAPVNGARVTVSASPPDSAPTLKPVRAPGQGIGQYAIDHFSFDRAGVWTLTARAEFQGRWAEVAQRVTVRADSSR